MLVMVNYWLLFLTVYASLGTTFFTIYSVAVQGYPLTSRACNVIVHQGKVLRVYVCHACGVIFLLLPHVFPSTMGGDTFLGMCIAAPDAVTSVCYGATALPSVSTGTYDRNLPIMLLFPTYFCLNNTTVFLSEPSYAGYNCLTVIVTEEIRRPFLGIAIPTTVANDMVFKVSRITYDFFNYMVLIILLQ